VSRTHQLYAVKFYLDRREFEAERAHLTNPKISHIMPAIDDIVGNEDGLLTSLGQPLPPMVIVEKGESHQWQRRSPADFASTMQIMLHLNERVVDLHAGYVHRDLKPANVITYEARNGWMLIDIGGAAEIGAYLLRALFARS